MPGIERGTSYMQSKRSTAELHALWKLWKTDLKNQTSTSSFADRVCLTKIVYSDKESWQNVSQQSGASPWKSDVTSVRKHRLHRHKGHVTRDGPHPLVMSQWPEPHPYRCHTWSQTPSGDITIDLTIQWWNTHSHLWRDTGLDTSEWDVTLEVRILCKRVTS